MANRPKWLVTKISKQKKNDIVHPEDVAQKKMEMEKSLRRKVSYNEARQALIQEECAPFEGIPAELLEDR